MINKRGDMSIGVLIALVLGIVILVVLLLGFTGVWKTLLPWLNVDNNVNTIVNQCQVSCTTNDVYGYCNMQKTLISPDLAKEGVKGNCTYFATDVGYTKYGVAQCAGLCPTA